MSDQLSTTPIVEPDPNAQSGLPFDDSYSSESCGNPAVLSVSGLGKTYRMWRRPSGRVFAPLLERLASTVPEGTNWRRRLTDLGARQFTDFDALSTVDFTVRRGECVGIMGRNGSGKSTLLQIIAGTLQPTTGSVEVNGRIGALLELGSGFNPEFTGRENVLLNASILGLSGPEIEARFDAIEHFADIGEFIDQPIKTYSSGMVVRLAFAVNSIIKPDILLIDEALAVGDVFFQQKCYRLLRNDLKDCVKIIVSHDLHALATIAQRAIVLDRGRMRFQGPTREAIAFYTKLVQDEAFASGTQRATGGRVQDLAAGTRYDDLPWARIGPESTSGRKEVVIEEAALTDSALASMTLVSPEDLLIVHAKISVRHAPARLIFGYIVLDRYGKEICGDTNLPLRPEGVALEENGAYYYRLSFSWPYLKPADYTITIGVGDGDHPFQHVIQCWAHNVFGVRAISPYYDIHAQISNPVKDFHIEPLASEDDA